MNDQPGGRLDAPANTMRVRSTRHVMTVEDSFRIYETMAWAMEFVYELGSWVVYEPAPNTPEERAADETFDECFRSWLSEQGERYTALLEKMGDDVYTPRYYAWSRVKTWSSAKEAA